MPVLADRTVADYVAGVGRRLARVAPGPKYPYSFTVANYRELNAFALPGGPVWINRGALEAAGNESQVAAVLAHEIAHIAQRHAADRVTTSAFASIGLGVLGAMLGNTGAADAARAAAGLGANLWMLKFSRDDEAEADRVGLQMLTRAGWDGRGLPDLFRTMQREAGRNPGSVETWLSSHPSPKDREVALASAAKGTSGGRRDTAEFQRVKARLKKMPAAKAMPR
jgi:predicted Zn-dependent protease